MGGTRAHLQDTKVDLIHQQGPLQLQDLLELGTKATLCHLNYEAKARALLREPPDPRGDLIWARGNYRKPSCHGEDRQVGSRAHGARHNLYP
jgi:hypothetical protein